MKRPAAALLGCLAILLLVAVAGVATIPSVQTGTWQPMASMLAPRSGAAATLLQDHRVLLSGGTDGTGALNSAEVFNLDGSFSSVAAMGTPRARHTATLLPDGRVLVAGGETSGGVATNSAEIFDPVSGSWTAVAGGMVEARSAASASLLPDGRVFIAGGQNGTTPSQSAEIYDPVAGQFSYAGTLAAPRMSAASAVLADGRVLITGGSNGNAALNSTDIFDPASNTISAGPALTSPRLGHSATSLLDGRVLVAGGNNGSADVATAEIFDPASGNFAPAASSLAAPRRDHIAVLLPNNNSVLILGGTSDGNETNSVETFTPWTGLFASTGAMSVARQQSATAALSQDGLLLTAGGFNSNGTLASAELYGFATVKTDAADYAPGSIVTITGTGWQPGETVTLTLVESPLVDTHPVLTAVADGQGNIINTQFSPDVHDVGIRFYLTASGIQSQAQNTFTDNLKIGVSRNSPTAASISEVTASNFTVTFAISNNNNGVNSSANLSGSWTLSKTGSISTADATSGNFTNLSTSTPLLLTFHFTAPAAPEAGDTITLNSSITSPTCTAGGGNQCSDSATYTVGIFAPPSISKSFSPSSIDVGGLSTLSFTLTNSNGTALTNAAFNDPLPAGLQVSSTPSPSNTCGGTFSAAAGATAVSLSGGTIPTSSSCSLSVSVTSTTSGTKNNTTGVVTATGGGISLTGNTGSSSLTVNATVPTTLVLNSVSPNSVSFGSSGLVTFTATLTRNDTSAGAVGATVAFTVDGAGVGSAVTAAGGVATLSTYDPSGLSVATHNVAASFSAATISGIQFGASSSGTLSLTVGKGTPTITWANPADITYGTSLTTTQLNATASVPGTFTYTPASGTVLNAGNAQTLHVDFTPTDTTNYTSTSKNVQINVLQATPTVTVTDPMVTYDGNPHSATAVAKGIGGVTVAGSFSFTYDGSATAPTNAKTSYAVVASFTSSDGNYTGATGNGSLTIKQATPTVTVTDPMVTYDGNPHPATATAVGVDGHTAVAGSFSFTYDGNATTPTNAKTSYAVVATFTSSDGNYAGATGNGFLTIKQATPTVTVTDPMVTYDGSPHSATAVAKGIGGVVVAGSFSFTYDGSATAPTNAKTSYAVVATFTSSDGNYTGATGNGSLTIKQATPTVTVTDPMVTYDGNPHPATATAVGVDGHTAVAGSFSFTYDGSATTPTNAKTSYAVVATFTSSDGNYTGAVGNGSLTINKATPTVTVSFAASPIPFDGLVHAATATVTGVGGMDLTTTGHGTLTLTYVPGPGAPVNAGSYSASAHFVSSDSNYNNADSTTASLVINKAQTSTAVSSSANPSALGQNVTFTATVSNTQNAAVPTGSVQFTIDGSPYGAAVALTAGSASVATSSLTVGGHTISAVFTNTDGNFMGSSSSVYSQQVSYGFLGLQAPYAMPPTTFNVKRTMPLKWQYTDVSGMVVNSSSANPVILISGPYVCGQSDNAGSITVNDSGSSGYQYDPTTNTWQFNWQIKGNAPGCYNISVKSQQSGQTNGTFPIAW